MNNDSFTLLELVIVLALLAIIASVAVARFVDLSDKAFGIGEEATMSAFRSCLLLYRGKYDVWPDWVEDADAGTPGPFELLDNPPGNKSSLEVAEPGKDWIWDRGMGAGGSALRIDFFCPHMSNITRKGIKWTYVLTQGDIGSCGAPDTKIYYPGTLVRCDWTPVKHKW